MGDIIQLKTGNYRGVDILFTELSTTGGNRLIKYLYPGSDNQSIERQGKLPRSFNITIWIQSANYYADRDALLRVMEDGKRGTFTHPTFGDIENVISGSYTLTERSSELGRASITVVFEVDEGDGVPVEAGALATQVEELAGEVISQCSADFADSFVVTPSYTGNFASAVSAINGAMAKVRAVVAKITAAADKVADIGHLINQVESEVNSLATLPSELADRFDVLLSAVNSFSDTASDVASMFEDMFDFGSDDPEIKLTTAGRIERAKNLDAMRANIRTQALAYAYLNNALIDFDNIDDLETAQETLEEQYQDSYNNQALSDEAKEVLNRLRSQAQKTFDAATVQTQGIVTITTPLTPLTPLVYAYYGSTELVDTIAALNDIDDNGFVEGELRMLTQ